ncbi:hypothetical protein FRC09_016971 [Ceratobasidium sp. 395]|nr:hypothetical protein FRC09_016971 [Ceratobasidium sp. 395]
MVIESIPNRFHALEGKTIAIDATLVTQRLHFTPDPRPHRHVLGWYQLIAELRQHDIKVVCVFDGKHRIPAKSNEVERRRQMRLQAQVRGAWEKSRHERLLSLTEALQSVENLSEDHQQQVLNSLRNQADQLLSPGSKVDTSLVLDPSAEDTQQGSMVASTYLLPDLESLLPVEDSSVPHSTVVTSSSATDETSVRQNLTECSFVISPAGGEKPVSVQDSPPSDNFTAMKIPTLDQNKPFSENVAPSTNKQAVSPNGMLSTKDGMALEPRATPEVSAKPTTLQDASVAAQLHRPTQTEDFGIPDTDQTAANKASSGANRSAESIA